VARADTIDAAIKTTRSRRTAESLLPRGHIRSAFVREGFAFSIR